MCRRRRWWLALNNDDKAPDSPFDPSRFRTNPSIHPYSHPSDCSLSLLAAWLLIYCLLFWVCVAQVNEKSSRIRKTVSTPKCISGFAFVSPSTMQIHFWSARFSISDVVVINLTTTTSSANKRDQKNSTEPTEETRKRKHSSRLDPERSHNLFAPPHTIPYYTIPYYTIPIPFGHCATADCEKDFISFKWFLI